MLKKGRVSNTGAEQCSKCGSVSGVCYDLCDDCLTRFNQLAAENERLRTNTYCAYCGAEFPVDGDASDVAEHIAKCDKHPITEYRLLLRCTR